MGRFTATVSASEGKKYEKPPAGVHAAVLIGLFDLGTHSRTYSDGKTKRNRKLFFVWELTAEADSKGENFVVGCDFTWSLHDKANLRKFVESWIGEAIPKGGKIDLDDFLDKPCLITLMNNDLGNNKTVVDVVGIAPPMRGLPVPPASRGVATFLMSDIESQASLIDLPDWVPRLYGREIREEIKASEEWRAMPDEIPY
jgi:hypothetical protein